MRPYVWLKVEVSCPHGLPVFQHPVVVAETKVLNGWRVPDGLHPIVHVPLLQNGVPPLQTLPHLPQLAALVRTSVQALLQTSCPGWQHLPDVHHSPDAHAVVHEPQ